MKIDQMPSPEPIHEVFTVILLEHRVGFDAHTGFSCKSLQNHANPNQIAVDAATVGRVTLIKARWVLLV